MPDMGDYEIDSGASWALFSELYRHEFEPRSGDRMQSQDAKPEGCWYCANGGNCPVHDGD